MVRVVDMELGAKLQDIQVEAQNSEFMASFLWNLSQSISYLIMFTELDICVVGLGWGLVKYPIMQLYLSPLQLS